MEKNTNEIHAWDPQGLFFLIRRAVDSPKAARTWVGALSGAAVAGETRDPQTGQPLFP